ncbi:MAG: alpha/beta hydrolase family protein [Gemmatimonadota bacterium]
MTDVETRFETGEAGPVSALFRLPPDADRLLVLAHGAGAGMRHAFLESLVGSLTARGIATFRYQFPYIEAGRRRPDREPVLVTTVRAAVGAASEVAGDLPLLAGGKSMGGRMTSRAAAREPLPGVRGLVFFGFPLHAPGKPSKERADHLDQVDLPMLFLQGDRDAFAGLELLGPVVDRLGRRATLHLVAGADHGFHVLKRSGRTDDQVLGELADRADVWSAGVLAGSGTRGGGR